MKVSELKINEFFFLDSGLKCQCLGPPTKREILTDKSLAGIIRYVVIETGEIYFLTDRMIIVKNRK